MIKECVAFLCSKNQRFSPWMWMIKMTTWNTKSLPFIIARREMSLSKKKYGTCLTGDVGHFANRVCIFLGVSL